MKPIPFTPETLTVARNIVWFESPEQALADPVRFMAYAMTSALPEDMRIIRRYVPDDEFREALDHAPPGIIDPRSWAYWNSKMGRDHAPPRAGGVARKVWSEEDLRQHVAARSLYGRDRRGTCATPAHIARSRRRDATFRGP